MGEQSGTSSKRRRWLLVAACVAVFIAGAVCLSRPRFDRRMVGTWSGGTYLMVIRNDGVADSFFGRSSTSSGQPGGWYATGGPLTVRTSGHHIEIVRLAYDRTTIYGWLQFALAVLKGNKTESVEFWGTIVDINDQTMALEILEPEDLHGPKEGRQVRCEYRRDRDAPFDLSRLRSRLFDRLRSIDRSLK